eukprot:5069173-Pleurochrysis_carterae.AAC.3
MKFRLNGQVDRRRIRRRAHHHRLGCPALRWRGRACPAHCACRPSPAVPGPPLRSARARALYPAPFLCARSLAVQPCQTALCLRCRSPRLLHSCLQAACIFTSARLLRHCSIMESILREALADLDDDDDYTRSEPQVSSSAGTECSTTTQPRVGGPNLRQNSEGRSSVSLAAQEDSEGIQDNPSASSSHDSPRSTPEARAAREGARGTSHPSMPDSKEQPDAAASEPFPTVGKGPCAASDSQFLAEAESLAKQLTNGMNFDDEDDSFQTKGGAKSGTTWGPSAADSEPSLASDMEATLAALARSAESLTKQQAADDDDGTAACMELLMQLGEGLGGLGGAPAPAGPGGGAWAGPVGDGESSDAAFDGLLDNLVGQLLSKDVMVEPLRLLHEEFPRYLQTHRATLAPEDLQRCTKQQAVVAKILRAYEENPEDTDTVAQLMQEMQQYGPPPTEIAAPGTGCSVS